MARTEAELSDSDKTVRSAVIYGGRMSLKWTAGIPAAMAIGYLLLILYFKKQGGYRQVHLQSTEQPSEIAPTRH